jgi:outer membrane receptor protein involved in Fe transport
MSARGGAVRRRLAPLLAFALTAAITVSSARALADDVADEADLQFELGADRYRAGEFRQALVHFLASNRLAPNRNVVFNIARAYEQLKQYPDAYRYYRRALEGETDRATVENIRAAIKRMTPNVAVLNVTSNPPGAKIYLVRKDLGERGSTPQSLGLGAGRYRVIAEMPGHKDAETSVDVTLGKETEVTLALEPILGRLRVAGDAAGATVHLDAETAPALCTVPCEANVPPGRHVAFIARAGYRTSQVVVDVPPKGEVSISPSIVPVTGTLLVNVDERGAVIFVDDKPAGASPAVVVVPVGEHTVRATLAGFQTVERLVTITPDEQVRVDVQLSPAEQVEAASRASEAVEDAPASVTIISSRELRAMGYPTVWEALRGVRGVYLTDDRGYPTLGIRGFGRPGDYGNRTLLLLDGQPMSDNWIWSTYASFDLRTDLEDVERIEIVRGPGSVLYGTSAFSGVINVVTRGRDTPPGGEVGASVVENGVARARARATVRLGKDAGVWTSISGGHSRGRTFFIPEYADDPATGGMSRNNDGLDVGTWTGRLWWKDFTVQWSLNRQKKHLPTGQFDTIFGDHRTRQTDTRMMIEGKYEPQISSNVQSLTRVHYNYYNFLAFFAYPPEDAGVEKQVYDGSWGGLEQRFVFSPSSAFRLTVGGEGQLHFRARQQVSNADGVAVDTNDTFQLGAGYVTADVIPSRRVKLHVGSRLDVYSTFGSSLNPRVGVIVKPCEAGNVKFLVGKAFRSPSVYELFFLAPGSGQRQNLDLKPESIYSAEIELSHRFSPTVVGVVTGFGNYIKDLIAQRNLPGSTEDAPSYRYQNTDAPVLTVGGEAELRREWKDGWMISGSTSIQESRYLKSESLSDLVAMERHPELRQVANAPLYLASMKGAVPLVAGSLLAMTRISLDGPRYDRNDTPDSPPQGRSEPGVIWDLVVSGTEPRWNLRYSAGVYNLLDWRYSLPVSPEFRGPLLEQNRRTLMLSANVGF